MNHLGRANWTVRVVLATVKWTSLGQSHQNAVFFMPFVLGFLVSFWCVMFQILRGAPPSQNPTSFIRSSGARVPHWSCNHDKLQSRNKHYKLQSRKLLKTKIYDKLCQVLGSFRWFRWSTRSMNCLNSQIGDPSISKSSGIPCVEGLDVRLGCKCLMNPVWVHQGSLINQDNSGEWRQDLHAKWWYYPDPRDPLRSPEVSEVRCTRTCFAFHSPTVVFWNLRFHLALNKSVGHLWKLAMLHGLLW